VGRLLKVEHQTVAVEHDKDFPSRGRRASDYRYLPPHIPCVRDHLELLTAVQPRAVGVHLKGDEAADRKLVQPGVVDPKMRLAPCAVIPYESSSSRWSHHGYTSHASASTSARDSPRRTFLPADRSRPAFTYSATVHR
jgi:hypothetical protein